MAKPLDSSIEEVFSKTILIINKLPEYTIAPIFDYYKFSPKQPHMCIDKETLIWFIKKYTAWFNGFNHNKYILLEIATQMNIKLDDSVNRKVMGVEFITRVKEFLIWVTENPNAEFKLYHINLLDSETTDMDTVVKKVVYKNENTKSSNDYMKILKIAKASSLYKKIEKELFHEIKNIRENNDEEIRVLLDDMEKYNKDVIEHLKKEISEF